MSLVPNRPCILKDRAAMLHAARHFFSERHIMEVDCPLVSQRASVDAHIDLIPADTDRFLHSSPEYGMKRLLSEGAGDIFQLSHVFRRGEYGKKHNPEFMMAEWYRLEISFQEMIDETLDFIRLFIGEQPCDQMSYREIFLRHTGIDIKQATVDSLMDYCQKNNIEQYPHIETEGVDALLNLILGAQIEPHLGDDDRLFVVTHYPASQSALAQKTQQDDFEVAERFEIYYRGLELANGYHELADAQEQNRRLVEGNVQREKLGKSPLPIDTYFLDALKNGLPDCCGVAVGFDRCMMLRHKTTHLRDIIPFDWELA
jgi:elongation factor P--(R)-beta-lysine ligase